MKKKFYIKLFAVLALLIAPLALLSACDDTQYFSVDVQTSQSARGRVIGPNATEQLPEGSNVALTAIDGEGSFICWIKDRTNVVSIDKEYSFSLNADTAGVYVGLFTQTTQTKMMYAALTTLSVDIADVTDISVKIDLVPANAVTEARTIFSKPLTETTISAYDGTVFSFLNKDNYLLNVEVSYKIAGEIPETISFNDLELNRADFTSDSLTISDNEDNPNVTLKFEKLSRALVESQTQN